MGEVLRDDKGTAIAGPVRASADPFDKPRDAVHAELDGDVEVRALLAETHELLRAHERDLATARARADLQRDPREVEWEWDLVASRIDHMNMREVFGWEPVPSADVTSWILGIHDEDRGRVIAGLHGACDAGLEIWRDEYRYLRGDGSFAWAASRAIILRDGDGRPSRLVGVTRDAGAARRDEAARYAHLRRVEAIAGVSRAVARAGLALPEVLDTVVRAVADLAVGGATVRFLSEDRTTLEPPAAMSDVDPVRAHHVRSAIAHPHPAHVGLVGRVLETGERAVIPILDRAEMLRSPRGAPLGELFEALPPRSFIVTPLRVRGEVLGVLTAARYDDVRPFDHDDGLVIQEIADLAACAIESARLYARADRLLRFAETFVGVLGHDLRNPLHAIATSAQIILRADDVERTARPARRIAQSASRMARMIDQLLDFTRIRVGGLTVQRAPVSAAEICQDVIDELCGAQGSLGVDVLVRGDTVGFWDPDRLSQLVSNLVANALNHGDPACEVQVRVDGDDAAAVSIEVANGGTIPPDLLPTIFEPLNTGADPPPAPRRRGESDTDPGRPFADSAESGESGEPGEPGGPGEPIGSNGAFTVRRRSKRSGLGLGLFIVQQIARAHGGDVQVASTPEDGTRFRVWLPRRSPS